MRAMGKLEKSIASLESENATSPVMDTAGEFAATPRSYFLRCGRYTTGQRRIP